MKEPVLLYHRKSQLMINNSTLNKINTIVGSLTAIVNLMHYLSKRIAIFMLVAVLMLASHTFAFAQEACSQILIKAQIAYYEGRANEVSQIMETCLKDGFTRDEKLQAYRLLTISYLYLNEPIEAENALLALLRLNPEYKINESVDPAEFINLYKQFRTHPVYLAGFKLGGNVSFIQLLKNFSLDNTAEAQIFYAPQLSYQGGASLELPLNKRFSFSPEIYVAGKKYMHKTNLFGFENLTFNEAQHRIELPLMLTYNINKKRFNPFFNAGFSFDALFSSYSKVRREDNDSSGEVKKEVTGPNITLNAQRRLINYSAIAGAGFKFKSGRNLITAEVRYKLGMMNMVKKNERYSNTELIYRYGYLDNDIVLNSIVFSLGYIIPVYQPKILKRE